MNLLDFTTTINKIKINVKLSDHTLRLGRIMDKDHIYKKIKAELNMDYSFEQNAQFILNALQPYCYEVSITPPNKGFNYEQTVIVRK